MQKHNIFNNKNFPLRINIIEIFNEKKNRTDKELYFLNKLSLCHKREKIEPDWFQSLRIQISSSKKDTRM